MQPRRYRFSSSFNLAAPRKRVHDVLVDLQFYGDWWPQVRAVGKIDGDHALVVCRSVLPYDLELELTAVSRASEVLEVAIDGPIRGWARYHLADLPVEGGEDGPGATSLRFEQEVYAEAPLFVLASYVAKPLLTWNHRRMMRGAEQGLRALLEPGGQPDGT
ncbi:MAG: polyketide cyclase [Marmoricola sp.]|nr:polyketide cyclase [Marmoricola sp.]